jgi:hypothetical protein
MRMARVHAGARHRLDVVVAQFPVAKLRRAAFMRS